MARPKKKMITREFLVKIIYEKTSGLRAGSVSKHAVRHGVFMEMPFVNNVMVKTTKEEEWFKEFREKQRRRI